MPGLCGIRNGIQYFLLLLTKLQCICYQVAEDHATIKALNLSVSSLQRERDQMHESMEHIKNKYRGQHTQVQEVLEAVDV